MGNSHSVNNLRDIDKGLTKHYNRITIDVNEYDELKQKGSMFNAHKREIKRLEDRVSQLSLELSNRPQQTRTKEMLIEQRNQQDILIRQLQCEVKEIKQNEKNKREHNKKVINKLHSNYQEIDLSGIKILDTPPEYEAPPLYEEEGELPNYTNY